MNSSNASKNWRRDQAMKTTNKNRLGELENRLAISSPSSSVIIYDPKLPIPEHLRKGKKVVILLPDNHMRVLNSGESKYSPAEVKIIKEFIEKLCRLEYEIIQKSRESKDGRYLH